MKKALLFPLMILLFACNQSCDTNVTSDSSKNKGAEPTTEKAPVEPTKTGQRDSPIKDGDYIAVKSLFRMSPLTIFDETTEGLTLAEKNDLLEKGESATWKITDESKTKLAIQSKELPSKITLRFLK